VSLRARCRGKHPDGLRGDPDANRPGGTELARQPNDDAAAHIRALDGCERDLGIVAAYEGERSLFQPLVRRGKPPILEALANLLADAAAASGEHGGMVCLQLVDRSADGVCEHGRSPKARSFIGLRATIHSSVWSGRNDTAVGVSNPT